MRACRKSVDVHNLHEGVGGCLKQHHGSLGGKNGRDGVRVGGVDVVDNDASMGGEELEQTVAASIQVITSDDLIARLEKTSNDVQCGHAARHDQRAMGVHDLGHVSFEVGSRRIATAGVVVGISLSFESGRLVDWHRAGIVLVPSVRVDELSSQVVLSLIAGRAGDGRGRHLVTVEVQLLVECFLERHGD